MEIELSNVCTKNLTNMNAKFNKNKINSLITDNENIKVEFLNLLYCKECINSGVIKYGIDEVNSKTTLQNKLEISKKIYYLKDNYESMLFNINIKEDIKHYINNYDQKKLEELLKLFHLNNDILEKNYLELSSSEIRKVLLIIGLIGNYEIIIFNNPTLKLDNKAIQSLIKILKKIKRENKMIIISSNDVNFLLEVSDEILVIKNKKILEQGNKYEILSNEKILNKLNLKVPNILEFANKTQKLKNIKIGYRDNINDLIKDIFRYAK